MCYTWASPPPSRSGYGFGFEVVLQHLGCCRQACARSRPRLLAISWGKANPSLGGSLCFCPAFCFRLKGFAAGRSVSSRCIVLRSFSWTWVGGTPAWNVGAGSVAVAAVPTQHHPAPTTPWSWTVVSEKLAWPGWGCAGSSCSVAVNSLASCLWFSYYFLAFQLEVGM